ncbi:NAD(P)-dependent alcohol dehydrogenase [Mumia sp. zg.B53]|uniref:NAD(P)-dependent alcohol dehydrogenase n=1 Tax=unclassified Mumia TaxID=2621872 RepID=UPI001C6EC888|nr:MULTISPECIES: NAD(P)-dependent alcohol dehydrogenase [unclassified Mumia]MBW9210356.1 NAD(P)-dependent alcohol dehydrogenase [Mumia sp. zg.B21]MBW9214974.1 NAD(P)-dependent alcohol dehydrogenase [Mumia sp. zg.B53]
MRALQYVEIGSPPRVVEVETPEPGPGEIRLKVSAAGVCHSDEFVMSLPAEAYTFGLPLTLGHEGAGTVDALGEGVTNVALGDSVAVYGPWGCGRCHACSRGAENSCPYAVELGIAPPGLGAPGAIAEYMIVDDVRHLVPLGDLDPVRNVSLTDAGLTPYHAIRTAMPKLVGGSTAVVIGAGGLGHVAIQILRALTGARVIALDVNDEKLALAKEVGAHEAVLSNDEAPEAIKRLTGGLGAEAVFDFVGAPATGAIAAASVALEGDVQLVGIGGGAVPVGFGVTPYDAAFRAPYWGTRSELIEVFEMARRDQLHVEIETYSLDEAPQAYERLHAGEIRGRAVVLPNG